MLKLRPFCRSALWGGKKLKEKYGFAFEGENLAEAWVLAAHRDGASIVENGPHAGESLLEYWGGNPHFPLMVKLIDAAEDLSVQVHPTDEYALRWEGQSGKTEMWYVLDAEPGAYLILGPERELTAEEFRCHVENNTLSQVLHRQYVHRGEAYLIPPGTIHAIGKGILVAEVQQNSTLTYRIYDYGRRDNAGNLRELHIEKACAVSCLKPYRAEENFGPHLVTCPYFTVDLCHAPQQDSCRPGEILAVLILDGEGTVRDARDCFAIKQGDSILLEEGNFQIDGSCRYLRIRAAIEN